MNVYWIFQTHHRKKQCKIAFPFRIPSFNRRDKINSSRKEKKIYSSQPPQHEIAKHKKHNDTAPEDPLILPCPPLHHPNRVPADPERVRHAVQPPLRALQHISLITQVAQHRAAPLEIFIELGVRWRGKGLFAERMCLAWYVCRGGAERRRGTEERVVAVVVAVERLGCGG